MHERNCSKSIDLQYILEYYKSILPDPTYQPIEKESQKKYGAEAEEMLEEPPFR